MQLCGRLTQLLDLTLALQTAAQLLATTAHTIAKCGNICQVCPWVAQLQGTIVSAVRHHVSQLSTVTPFAISKATASVLH